MFRDDLVLVLDVDGVLTDGKFYSTKDGKFLKCFGADDWDALKEVMKCIQVQFISADKKGFEITKRRIVDEMNWTLDCVTHIPRDRWGWIKSKFPDKKIIFIGDGIYDWHCLEMADYGICPIDSLDHVKKSSNYVSSRRGAERFVADACIKIIDEFLLDIDISNIGG